MTFADNVQSKIIGTSNVGKNDYDLITDVHLVEGLKHNLLNISQFYDKGYKVIFEHFLLHFVNILSISYKVILSTKRHLNTYMVYLDDLLDQNVKCLASFMVKKWIWYKKVGHVLMKLISKLF